MLYWAFWQSRHRIITMELNDKITVAWQLHEEQHNSQSSPNVCCHLFSHANTPHKGWGEWHLLTNSIIPPLKENHHKVLLSLVFTCLFGLQRRNICFKGSSIAGAGSPCWNVNITFSSWGYCSVSHLRPCQNLWGLNMESFDGLLESILEPRLSNQCYISFFFFFCFVEENSWKVTGFFVLFFSWISHTWSSS